MDQIGWAISLATSVDDIRRCFPVMLELRTHLADAEEFLRPPALRQ